MCRFIILLPLLLLAVVGAMVEILGQIKMGAREALLAAVVVLEARVPLAVIFLLVVAQVAALHLLVLPDQQ